jgi:hypothetical protein
VCVIVPIAYGTGSLLSKLAGKVGRVRSVVLYAIVSVGAYGVIAYLTSMWAIGEIANNLK